MDKEFKSKALELIDLVSDLDEGGHLLNVDVSPNSVNGMFYYGGMDLKKVKTPDLIRVAMGTVEEVDKFRLEVIGICKEKVNFDELSLEHVEVMHKLFCYK